MSTSQSWKAQISCLGYMKKVTKTTVRQQQQQVQHSYLLVSAGRQDLTLRHSKSRVRRALLWEGFPMRSV